MMDVLKWVPLLILVVLILILVVLISLVIIFKKQLTALVNTIFIKISGQAGEIY